MLMNVCSLVAHFFVPMTFLPTTEGVTGGILGVKMRMVKGMGRAAIVIWGDAGMADAALGAVVEWVRWGGWNLALAVAASALRPFHPCIPVKHGARFPLGQPPLQRRTRPKAMMHMSTLSSAPTTTTLRRGRMPDLTSALTSVLRRGGCA